jgi:hypothetical protein
MSRPNVTLLKVLSSVGLAAGICLCAAPEASAQEVIVYPDSSYVAVAQPVYYNGIAHYWYRDRWFYRTGTGWGWYAGGEPGWLHDYRYRTWPGGVYYPGYHYGAGYGGGYHGWGGGGWHGGGGGGWHGGHR